MEVRIKNIDKLKQAFAAFPDTVRHEINSGIDDALVDLDSRARREAPVDTTNLRASHRISKRDRFNMVGVLQPNVDYAAAVHEGTRPHWPPYGKGDPLEKWARRRNIDAFLVARSISRKGTKPNPWLERASRAELRNVETIMQNAVDRAISRTFTK